MAFLLPGIPNELPINAIGIPYVDTDAPELMSQAAQPAQWGIFQNGAPILVAGQPVTGGAMSVATLSYKQDWLVSDYPLEEGAFASYDKVLVPFDVRLRYVVTGSPSDITDFLNQLATIADPAQQGLSAYDVFMPEQQYTSCSISHYDFTRTVTNGIGMLVVDIWLVQIRIVGTEQGQFNTQQPSGSDPTNLGNVQTQPPTSVQQAVSFN